MPINEDTTSLIMNVVKIASDDLIFNTRPRQIIVRLKSRESKKPRLLKS